MAIFCRCHSRSSPLSLPTFMRDDLIFSRDSTPPFHPMSADDARFCPLCSRLVSSAAFWQCLSPLILQTHTSKCELIIPTLSPAAPLPASLFFVRGMLLPSGPHMNFATSSIGLSNKNKMATAWNTKTKQNKNKTGVSKNHFERV